MTATGRTSEDGDPRTAYMLLCLITGYAEGTLVIGLPIRMFFIVLTINQTPIKQYPSLAPKNVVAIARI